MNKEEIRKALEIIREPITVNCKHYYYFDNENYSKLLNVYENCLWFINNFEQINDVVERLEQENKELHNKIDKAIDVIHTQMKNNPSYKENLKIIENNLIKGSCKVCDLKDSDVDE